MSQKVLIFPFSSVFPKTWCKSDNQRVQTLSAVQEISALRALGFKIFFILGDEDLNQFAFVKKYIEIPGEFAKGHADLFKKLKSEGVALSDITVFYNPPGPGPLPTYRPFLRWLLVPQDMYRHIKAESVLTWLQEMKKDGVTLVNYNKAQQLGITQKLDGLVKSSVVEEFKTRDERQLSFLPRYNTCGLQAQESYSSQRYSEEPHRPRSLRT